MRKFTAALIAMARAYAKALLTPARGRHSAAARRRRSTRVRPYAPLPLPERAAAPTPPRPTVRPNRPAAPVSLTAPTTAAPVADDVALVRPYYVAHERELARVQARATARLRSWSAPSTPSAPKTPVPPPAPSTVPAPRVPVGDLLATP
ncbi:hypothetical protein [Nocardiopsis sp. FIRDI 009]|uniref:hypothetical protein n=1 Tax=Nocardiopsis sp. FIRDI 009 TaxID=714197 RepID=UPI000E263153|nr:hypothetical protein [Nocardiopsis sp. FIRDI 009]